MESTEGGAMKEWSLTQGGRPREMLQLEVEPKEETETRRAKVKLRSQGAEVERMAHPTEMTTQVQKPVAEPE